MIILDSNQLRQAAPPDGPLLTLLRKLSDANGHTLAIPQMVLDEHLGYQEHEAQAEIAETGKVRAAALQTVPRRHPQQDSPPGRDGRRDDPAGVDRGDIQDPSDT